jgi:hypothetical protein
VSGKGEKMEYEKSGRNKRKKREERKKEEPFLFLKIRRSLNMIKPFRSDTDIITHGWIPSY